MAHSNNMAAENLPPEAVSGGIGALIVGALLVVKKFFGASDNPEKREDLRRENDRFNEQVVKNIGASVDNLAHIMQLHNTHQQEFREDFKEQMREFKDGMNEKMREFKDEVRDDIRELKGLK